MDGPTPGHIRATLIRFSLLLKHLRIRHELGRQMCWGGGEGGAAAVWGRGCWSGKMKVDMTINDYICIENKFLERLH